MVALDYLDSLSRFFVSRRKRCKDLSANTAQEKGDRRKGPATELEPGTYTLSRSFSHTSYRSQPQSFVFHRLMYRS